LEVDPELIVPDEDLSLAQGAIAPWNQGSGSAEYFQRVLTALARISGSRWTRRGEHSPYALGRAAARAELQGARHVPQPLWPGAGVHTGFEGAVPFVKRRHAETDSEWSRERYEGYMREVPCPACRGTRLKPESLAVLIGGHSIADISTLSIKQAAGFLGRSISPSGSRPSPSG
jgi:excinuclease ABC subunit A